MSGVLRAQELLLSISIQLGILQRPTSALLLRCHAGVHSESESEVEAPRCFLRPLEIAGSGTAPLRLVRLLRQRCAGGCGCYADVGRKTRLIRVRPRVGCALRVARAQHAARSIYVRGSRFHVCLVQRMRSWSSDHPGASRQAGEAALSAERLASCAAGQSLLADRRHATAGAQRSVRQATF